MPEVKVCATEDVAPNCVAWLLVTDTMERVRVTVDFGSPEAPACDLSVATD